MAAVVASVADPLEAKKPLKPARRSRNSIFSEVFSVSVPLSSSPQLGSCSVSPGRLYDAERKRTGLPSVRIEPPQPPASTSRVMINGEAEVNSPRVDAWDGVTPVDLAVPSSPHIALRAVPSRQFLLGVGRHAAVYLAACRSRDQLDAPWCPCAAKRMNVDREAQLGGFREAYILSRLYDGGKGPKSILRLIALRDERDTLVDARQSHRNREHARANSEADLDADGLAAAVSPTSVADMARAGSQSTPASPTVASRATMSPPYAAQVRRAVSLRNPPTSPHVQEKRLSWAGEAPLPEVMDPPRLVLVLELCPEGNLSTMLQKRPHEIGRRLWMKWALALAEAVAYAHAMGFMHADVKPGNVMLTTDLDVRLADWGMSLPISLSRLPTEGLGLGTTLYCAPEMVQSPPHPFGFPADIFSLGVTLSVLITGREPYRDARSPVEQMLWVSRGSYWQYEERYRLSLIGSPLAQSGSAPSLAALSRSDVGGGSRPLSRVSSVRSLRSLAGEATTDVPAADLSELFGGGTAKEHLATARLALSNAAARGSMHEAADAPSDPFATPSLVSSLGATYSDGAPVQYFLNGKEPVPEGIRALLQRMTMPESASRPTAAEVCSLLAVL